MELAPSSRLVSDLKNIDAEVEGWFAVGDELAFGVSLKNQKREDTGGDVAIICKTNVQYCAR